MTRSDKIMVAVCSYNAAHYLPDLLNELVRQNCSIPFEILIVDNNSTDGTYALIDQYAASSSIPIRYVNEPEQGIPFARNRAIEESLSNRYLAFIDADELPFTGWLQAAVDTLIDDQIDCVGGKISIYLPDRPTWLSDDLLPFYGEIDHSDQAFDIKDRSTPIWSGNIAYNTRIFHKGLRFDTRYNRKGKGVGGGSDGIMFRHFIEHGLRLRYEPNMAIRHLIPDEKINRRYFLKLHFVAGKKAGLYEKRPSGKKIAGIPRYMYKQLLAKLLLVLRLYFTRPNAYMREAMNLAYHIGSMSGLYQSQSNDAHG
ncbi:glycosyltransferase [Methylotuvimicrobium sp.]|uniref:glycosyltransferase family 2 protein n=1 Tax=Methylotuvimicrobium sp. TaxID=2822413 RepID=UPI003D64E447